MIEFLCPEGHKIRCPKEKAGRPAKCPKCGVGFRIPTIEELGLGESTVADASLAGEEVTDVARGASFARRQRKAAARPLLPPQKSGRSSSCVRTDIIFMGRPACRAGRANVRSAARDFAFRSSTNRKRNRTARGARKCPPSRNSLPRKKLPWRIRRPRLSPSTSKRRNPWISSRSWKAAVPGRQNCPAASGGPGGAILDLPSGPDGAVPAVHPLAALFIELWAARGEGSRVEVHLESGSVLVPDGYLKSHSQQDYAVLVTRDPDGCSTITVVPWNSISRIIMRAVKQVPGEVVR